MEVENLTMKDMKEQHSDADNFSILNETFMNSSRTGTYEIFDGKRYDIHKNYDENKCAAGTENTHKVAHIKSDNKRASFWVSLCHKHYKQVKNNNELDILSDTRPPY